MLKRYKFNVKSPRNIRKAPNQPRKEGISQSAKPPINPIKNPQEIP
jgi:hypothetical protein